MLLPHHISNEARQVDRREISTHRHPRIEMRTKGTGKRPYIDRTPIRDTLQTFHRYKAAIPARVTVGIHPITLKYLVDRQTTWQAEEPIEANMLSVTTRPVPYVSVFIRACRHPLDMHYHFLSGQHLHSFRVALISPPLGFRA